MNDVKLARMYALVAEIEAVKAKIEGMKTENDCCNKAGVTITYDEMSFTAKSNELYSIATTLHQWE